MGVAVSVGVKVGKGIWVGRLAIVGIAVGEALTVGVGVNVEVGVGSANPASIPQLAAIRNVKILKMKIMTERDVRFIFSFKPGRS